MRLCFALLVALFAAPTSLASRATSGRPPQPPLSADQIARRVQDRETGRDSRADLRMKLFDRRDRVRERALTLLTLRGREAPGAPKTAPDGDRLLIRFTYPNDIQILVHRENHDESTDSPGRTDVSLVVSADRTFSREKYRGRLFGVYNPNSHSGFARGIATASLRDNVALEGSLGWFAGSGLDTISRFADSDFVYLRLKYFF